MNDFGYPDNSFASKKKTTVEEKGASENRSIEKVVKNPVKTKKKNELLKFAEVFIADDISHVGSSLWEGVIVPVIKDTIVDILTKGANMLFHGSAKGTSTTKSTASRISYRDYYDKDAKRVVETQPRAKFDYEDMVIDTRGEAEEILDQMDAIIEKYGFVRVSDLYEMMDITAPYTGNNYGWTDIHTAKVVPTRGGYTLKLPRVIPLD